MILGNVDYIELGNSLRLKDLCKISVKLTRSSQVGFTHLGSGLLHGFLHPCSNSLQIRPPVQVIFYGKENLIML